jgi:hypothetical protein
MVPFPSPVHMLTSNNRGSNMPSTFANAFPDKPKALLLRHWEGTPPACWAKWGEPVNDFPGVWLFPVRNEDHLMDKLEALVAQTPVEESGHTMAACGSFDANGSIPLSVFSDCQPLPTLHTRLRHP